MLSKIREQASELEPHISYDHNHSYHVVYIQAVIGLLCEELIHVSKFLLELLDLLAEGSTSDASNLQFLKLQQVDSC